jgi:hypothetical protein
VWHVKKTTHKIVCSVVPSPNVSLLVPIWTRGATWGEQNGFHQQDAAAASFLPQGKERPPPLEVKSDIISLETLAHQQAQPIEPNRLWHKQQTYKTWRSMNLWWFSISSNPIPCTPISHRNFIEIPRWEAQSLIWKSTDQAQTYLKVTAAAGAQVREGAAAQGEEGHA